MVYRYISHEFLIMFWSLKKSHGNLQAPLHGCKAENLRPGSAGSSQKDVSAQKLLCRGEKRAIVWPFFGMIFLCQKKWDNERIITWCKWDYNGIIPYIIPI